MFFRQILNVWYKNRLINRECCPSSASGKKYRFLRERQKNLLQKLCEVLEQKLSKQREEAAQLQRKLYFIIKEEERRLARQSHTFQHICKKVSQQNSPADQQ